MRIIQFGVCGLQFRVIWGVKVGCRVSAWNVVVQVLRLKGAGGGRSSNVLGCVSFWDKFLGFRFWVLGFGFRVLGYGVLVHGVGIMIKGSEMRIQLPGRLSNGYRPRALPYS